MKWIIDLIKKHYKILLLVVGLLLLLVDISLRFWFWKGLHLEYDASNFNNIVTPIGTIITALLFFILTVRQLEMLRRQNQVIESQNIKPHFEREFERIRKILESDMRSKSEMEIFKDEINALNCDNFLMNLSLTLRLNEEFLNDYRNHQKGMEFSIQLLAKRNYYKYLTFPCFNLLLEGVEDFELVKQLIYDIENSPALQLQDKLLYKQRIKNEFVAKYIYILDESREGLLLVKIPQIFGKNPNRVDFLSIHETKFDKHYNFFKGKLY